MKKLRLLMLMLALAPASLASTRAWQAAKVIDTSETDVSSKLEGQKNSVHYTIETETMIYFVDYVFKPGHRGGDSSAPNISVNELTKIAVEGRHVYILDVAGKEVKLHIVRKTKKN